MAYQLTVLEKPSYLHFIITGDATVEDALGYMAEGVEICKAKNCFRVLVEDRLEGEPMGMMDMIPLSRGAAGKALGVVEQVAMVDNISGGPLNKFAAQVASTLGINIRICDSVEEADKWLRETHKKK